MNKIVLIFGAFNPVTNAHINMGILAKKKYPDADVIFVPANSNFLKDWKKYNSEDTLSERDRLKLLYDAVKPYGFGASEIDILSDGKTYNTVQLFNVLFEDKEIILCLGSDKLSEILTWYKGEELVKNYKFLIIVRDGVEKIPNELKKYKNNFTFMRGKYKGVSSTKVRNAVKAGKLEKVKNLIPEVVYNFYRRNNNV